jgi:hypothetical protein
MPFEPLVLHPIKINQPVAIVQCARCRVCVKADKLAILNRCTDPQCPMPKGDKQ